METIIVATIVVLALVYLVRRFYRGFKADAASPCGGECGGCKAAGACAPSDTCSGSDLDRLT